MGLRYSNTDLSGTYVPSRVTFRLKKLEYKWIKLWRARSGAWLTPEGNEVTPITLYFDEVTGTSQYHPVSLSCPICNQPVYYRYHSQYTETHLCSVCKHKVILN